jgi:HNH endonuclease
MTTTRDNVPLSFQRRVRLRAGQRCEYCGMPQAGQEATFHVDHVLPRRDGGPTTLENLALACVSCSLRKGARTEARDPRSGEMVGMFNPRTQSWEDHFELAGSFLIVGKTPTGRALVELLRMNRPAAVKIRQWLSSHPSAS